MISFNDVFTWFNYFESSSLIWPATLLRDLAVQKINEGKFPTAFQIIENLKSYQYSRNDPFERGEIWLECAMAYFGMGYFYKAARCLEMAKDEFKVETIHKSAVTCLMLSIVQWEIENEKTEAIINWNGAIDDFVSLKDRAEQDQWMMNWYSDRIYEMEESLQEKILEKFS